MEDCYICYCKKSKMHQLLCNHTLCYSCYIKLVQPHCPFCRQPFIYSDDDLHNKIVPPIAPYIDRLIPNFIHVFINAPFSRVRKNCYRKRRRNLTFEEILERRKNIKNRCKNKWIKKNGRLNKWDNM